MRLIDADALIKHEVEADRMGAMLVVGKGYILNAPTIDAVPVVRGEWVGVAHGRGGHECSKCRGYAPSFQNGAEYLSSYCPKCGAKMEGGGLIWQRKTWQQK